MPPHIAAISFLRGNRLGSVLLLTIQSRNVPVRVMHAVLTIGAQPSSPMALFCEMILPDNRQRKFVSFGIRQSPRFRLSDEQNVEILAQVAAILGSSSSESSSVSGNCPGRTLQSSPTFSRPL